MIQYALKCSDGHSFESWFQSAEAYDKLAGAGMVACVICGSSHVEKAIMAPRVRPARKAAAEPVEPESPAAVQPGKGALSAPASAAEQAIAALKKRVEENSDYVGRSFAKEARAIHEGDAPDRPIYGEAQLDEARALIEDGVPVTPLPFALNRKVN